MRVRLLALVLALALTWYVMNPAPGSASRVKRGGDQPDWKHREAKSPQSDSHRSASTEVDATGAVAAPTRSEVQEIDDLEWPDVIDLK